MIFFNANVAAIQAPNLLERLVPQAQKVEERIVPSMPDRFEKLLLAQYRQPIQPDSNCGGPIGRAGRYLGNMTANDYNRTAQRVEDTRNRGYYPPNGTAYPDNLGRMAGNTGTFIQNEFTSTLNQTSRVNVGRGIGNAACATDQYINRPMPVPNP